MIRVRVLAMAIALLALLGASGRAGAQDEGDPRLRTRLDARTAASVQATVDAARADGLPTEPLVLKALEGASKGAQSVRIVAAVSRLHSQLGLARTAIGSGSTEAEIIAATGALQAGVAAETLEQLRAARPSAPLTTALTVLSDLIGRGVPAPTASQTVLSLVRAGTPDGQLAVYGQVVERDVRTGRIPVGAAVGAPGGPPAGIPVSPGTPPAKGGGRPPIQ